MKVIQAKKPPLYFEFLRLNNDDSSFLLQYYDSRLCFKSLK